MLRAALNAGQRSASLPSNLGRRIFSEDGFSRMEVSFSSMARDVRSGVVGGDGDATEVVEAVTALSDTDTVEGTGSTEGWLTDDMDEGACDEATPEMMDGATLVASG